ncbi:MAG TPA: peptide-methionine (S)-S-oxide reductase MsrA [Propionibacteriaceae bacterium]|nr:peptide-methionine (S)-S-oxide reductase MsrA [Propionibacteriaceae bacterium]
MWFDKDKLLRAPGGLGGRTTPVVDISRLHRVLGTPLNAEPEGDEVAYFALGCFWGAEKLFWQLPGVYVTAVGYEGGEVPNPTYEEVCTGRTGHAETVKVVYDPAKVSYDDLLKVFFENHDPTQGMRQGNDIGEQYRSAIFTTDDAQRTAALAARDTMQRSLSAAGYGRITTEIVPAGDFFFAEGYHQQYLDANPNGYCPVHATGVTCG